MNRVRAYLGVIGLAATVAAGSAQAATFTSGDVFASVGNGNVQHYNAAGTLLETLNTGSAGYTTGSAFDTSGNLYVTSFTSNNVTKFTGPNDPHTKSLFGSGYSTPESIVFNAAGHAYVGSLGNGMRHFDASGAFVGSVLAGTRVDWMDLAADQQTMLYTQEGSVVKTVNVATGIAGANFASGLTNAFALRILGDGSVLVADYTNIKRFSAAGALIQTYQIAGRTTWFSLNLNNDGKSFWSGTFNDGVLNRFDIATGAVLQTLNTGVGGNLLYGVSVFGEVTQGCGNNCGGGTRVPEPTSILLLGSGLVGLGLRRFVKA